MARKAVRHQIVERLTRLGEASTHRLGDPHEEYAQLYHYHNTLEVIIIQNGWLRGLVGGKLGVMTKDMIVVIGDDVPHCVLHASDDCEVMLVHIPMELLSWDEERFPELTHGVEYIRSSKSGMIYQDTRLARGLTTLARKIGAADGFMRMSLIMRMLHVLSTTPPSSVLLAQQHLYDRKDAGSSIDRAFQYLYAHFRENFPLNALAGYAGLNVSACCRSFKRASGLTIGQFCTRLRIEYACNLLLTTNMDVVQVAYQSGYNSYPHFYTQFRHIMKMSPTAYREGTGILP